MWCEELKNGKYRYCERYVDPMTGKTRRISVTLDKNSRSAEKAAREILRQKMEQMFEPESMTFTELTALYLKEQETTVKMSTRTRNESCLGMVAEVIGDVQINKLTAGYIRKKLLESGKPNVTLNEYIARMKALLRWAYKNDYISDIRFLDKLDRFSDTSKKQKVQDKYLEREELEALLESMSGQWKDLTAFLALSGLRFGEAAALERKDVDIANRTINVNKTYDAANDIVTSPKTYNSQREVYMQDELWDLCKEIMFKSNVLSISKLFFYGKNGKNGHICYDAYRIYLRKHSKKVLDRVITPHVLRHTHASLLMESGVDIETISARLGHANSRITKEIYLHVTARLEEQRNQQMKEVHIISS